MKNKTKKKRRDREKKKKENAGTLFFADRSHRPPYVDINDINASVFCQVHKRTTSEHSLLQDSVLFSQATKVSLTEGLEDTVLFCKSWAMWKTICACCFGIWTEFFLLTFLKDNHKPSLKYRLEYSKSGLW